MMFGSVLKHFAIVRHVKKMQNLFSGLSAQFRGTKVGKHPFYSIGTKMMFGSLLEDFANLWHVKDAKFVFEPECTILGYKSCEESILLHWTQNDVGSVSKHFANLRHVKKMQNLCSSLSYYFGVPKL
jgi:hypothetical protein